MRYFLKITGLVLALLVFAAFAFAQLSPQLGGTPTKAQQQAYARSGHYQDGKFYNPLPAPVMTGGGQLC